jgi:hypothetical protein
VVVGSLLRGRAAGVKVETDVGRDPQVVDHGEVACKISSFPSAKASSCFFQAVNSTIWSRARDRRWCCWCSGKDALHGPPTIMYMRKVRRILMGTPLFVRRARQNLHFSVAQEASIQRANSLVTFALAPPYGDSTSVVSLPCPSHSGMPRCPRYVCPTEVAVKGSAMLTRTEKGFGFEDHSTVQLEFISRW